MGNTFRKLFDGLFGSREMRVVMLGEQALAALAAVLLAASAVQKSSFLSCPAMFAVLRQQA
jgi:hypothetical protein